MKKRTFGLRHSTEERQCEDTQGEDSHVTRVMPRMPKISGKHRKLERQGRMSPLVSSERALFAC